MHDLAPLIYDLTVMLGVAGLVVLIFQRIKQPVVLGYLVAGMIIGPYTPPYSFITDLANVKILSELGVIFLMFSLGLEFSFHKLTKVGFSALITGLIDVSFMLGLGYCTALLLGWSGRDPLFLGAAMAISSTTIIFKAMGELGLKTKRFADVIFGVLIVEDLLAILLLVALSTMVVTKNVNFTTLLFAGLKLVLVVGGWIIFGYFLLPSFFRRLETYISQETLTIVAVALCLLLVSIAAHFHYSTALGAFIMGSILAETVLVHRIEEIIVPIRDIFGAIFFIAVGMLIDPAIIIEQWYAILLIIVMLMLGKVFIISFGTFLTGHNAKTAIRAGFGMAQIGEFSFIIATLGLALNVINDKLYPIIVAVSCITTFTTPYMIRLSGTLSQQVDKLMPERIKFFLDRYSAWAYRVQTSSAQKSLLGSVTLSVITNGITIAIIFTLIDKYFYPYMYTIVLKHKSAKIIAELTAIILSSPFIWGMLFSHRSAHFPEYAKKTLNPIVFLIWLVTLAELVFLSLVYFHTWLTTAIFLVIVIVFFTIAYRHLEKSYHWFEGQLVKNIKKQKIIPSRHSQLSPWDTHLVEIEVGDLSPFVNQTLGDAHIRELYGVNIVAIRRGHHTIIAPRGQEILHDNDKLFVLGNDEQIDLFRNAATLVSTEIENKDHLSDFALKPILISLNHPFVGKSIRDSKIRETFNALVVGIERGNSHLLNPHPETVIQLDDILLLVGEDKKLQDLDNVII